LATKCLVNLECVAERSVILPSPPALQRCRACQTSAKTVASDEEFDSSSFDIDSLSGPVSLPWNSAIPVRERPSWSFKFLCKPVFLLGGIDGYRKIGSRGRFRPRLNRHCCSWSKSATEGHLPLYDCGPDAGRSRLNPARCARRHAVGERRWLPSSEECNEPPINNRESEHVGKHLAPPSFHPYLTAPGRRPLVRYGTPYGCPQ
jgi:hypothetical protein